MGCVSSSSTNGADYIIPGTGGRTNLHMAVLNGDHDRVRLMLEQRTSIMRASSSGVTPLLIAVRHGDLEMCTLLLKHGAMQTGDRMGVTPLTWAAASGYIEMCDLLLQNGATQELNRTSSLRRSFQSPLHAAAANGHLRVCEMLLDHGACINPSGCFTHTPLYLAYKEGHIEVCKLLLDRGAIQGTNEFGEPAWSPAIYYDCVELFRLVLDRREETKHEINDKHGRTALHIAAGMGKQEVCVLLLERGASVNAKDIKGRTPLLDAAAHGFIEICRLLLEHGATQEPDDSGNTPLIEAIRKSQVDVCKLLMEKGGYQGWCEFTGRVGEAHRQVE